jgi:hypothetical protein
MRQRPGDVIVDIANKAKFARRFQHPRHRGNVCLLHEAPLPVPPLRPWIGVDEIDAIQRLRRRPCQQFGGIAREQFYIADVVCLDGAEDFGHAVDIGLAADEADMRKAQCLRDQMFAATESDFETNALDCRIEQGCEFGGTATADVEREMRQQMLDQVGLMRAELVALAPSEERALRMSSGAIIGRGVGVAGGAAHRKV